MSTKKDNMRWVYLSYPLNENVFGYGNGDRFKKTQIRNMCCGDTSNNTEFSMPAHFGTHIDYPFHFSSTGKTSSDYSASDFVYQNAQLTTIDSESISDYIIRPKDLFIDLLNPNTELLFIKSGFCNKRHTDEYWEKGFGLAPESAAFLKAKFPQLKSIAIDLISLNSYQNRPLGREAHKAFLIEENILIIEEVDMRNIDKNTIFNKVIVAPLQLEAADGAPVTILAEIHEK